MLLRFCCTALLSLPPLPADARGGYPVLQAVRAGLLSYPEAHDSESGRSRGTLSYTSGEVGERDCGGLKLEHSD